MKFFDDDSVFVRDGNIGHWPVRLNTRYHTIVAKNQDALLGKRVLDLGCHDGRWMHAALYNGAEHVTGVDVRRELAMRCEMNLNNLNYARERFEVLIENFNLSGRWNDRRYDTALVMGVLYHTHSPVDLLRRVCMTEPRTIIVDTAVSLDPYASMRLKLEPHNNLGHGAADSEDQSEVLVAHPSRLAVELVLEHLGYQVETQQLTPADVSDASAALGTAALGINASNPLSDYLLGRRLIFVATRP